MLDAPNPKGLSSWLPAVVFLVIALGIMFSLFL